MKSPRHFGRVAYSIRNLPLELRERLRVEAAVRGKRLETIVVEALEIGVKKLETARLMTPESR